MTKPAFAFLIHARYLEDVYRKFPILRVFPENFTLFLLKKMPAVFISEITGLKDKDGNEIKGYVGRIPLTTHQMFEDRKLALEKMKDAIRIFSKKGVKLVGLGGLVPSMSRGGLDLMEEFKDIKFTTGRVYTVKTVTDYIRQVIEEFNFDKSEVKVAIVGAAGSIGSGCAEVLAGWDVDNLLLIDLERKLDTLVRKIEEIHKKIARDKLNIRRSHRISDVKWADVIIAATSAPEAVIEEFDLKPGAIVINDAQPSDIAPGVYERDDVLVIEGGVMRTPGVFVGFNMGLVAKEDSFCCLGEVLLLAYDSFYSDFQVGELDLKYMDHLSRLSEKLGFRITKYQNRFGYISDEKVKKIKEILKDNT